MSQTSRRCPLCEAPTVHARFAAEVRRAFEARYFQCDGCGLLFVADPVWLPQAYAEPLVRTDTGLVQRNLVLARWCTSLFGLCWDRHGRFLDVGAGLGLLVRLMRDVGFDFYAHDAHAECVLARGFEAEPADGPFEAVTCFEVLEHLPEPGRWIADVLGCTDTLVFTTELLPEPVPPPQRWWYYGLDHGQHISFYAERTLAWIARRHGRRLLRIGPLRVLTRRVPSPGRLALVRRGTPLGLDRWVRRRMPTRIGTDAETLMAVRGRAAGREAIP